MDRNGSYYEDIFENKQKKLKLENRISKNCKHPNVIRSYNVYEFMDKSANVFINATLMDKCQLPNLRKFINLSQITKSFLNPNFKDTGKIIDESSKEYLNIYLIQQIISALEYLHRHELIHFDFKPDNILLSNYFNVKISDFSLTDLIAQFRKENQCDQKTFQIRGGTEDYLSPEYYENGRIRNIYAFTVDIFPLACIIFLLYTGKKLFCKKEEMKESIKDNYAYLYECKHWN